MVEDQTWYYSVPSFPREPTARSLFNSSVDELKWPLSFTCLVISSSGLCVNCRMRPVMGGKSFFHVKSSSYCRNQNQKPSFWRNILLHDIPSWQQKHFLHHLNFVFEVFSDLICSGWIMKNTSISAQKQGLKTDNPGQRSPHESLKWPIGFLWLLCLKIPLAWVITEPQRFSFFLFCPNNPKPPQWDIKSASAKRH